MHNILVQDLATILVTGAIFGWLFKKIFNFPLVFGYLFGGILISLPIPLTPMVLLPQAAHNLADIGIILLLFSMGLHFGFRKLKSLSLATVFIVIAETFLMCLTGKILCTYLGFAPKQSLFLGAAISVSATSVVLKTLEDFQLKSHRFAEKLMGILLVEDAVAIFLLIWLSAITTAKQGSFPLFELVPVFIGGLVLWWLLGTILAPRLIRVAYTTGKEELLVILSLGMALGVAFISEALNFSPALGAFVMGSILAECREVRKIETLIEPIKNIFVLIFFTSVGLLFSPTVAIENWKIVISLALAVIFGKIIFNFCSNLIFGQGLKDSILIAGSMGQIGELAFVIGQVGKSLHIISESTFSTIVAVAVITMLSTPFILKLALYFSENCENALPKNVYYFLDFKMSAALFKFYKKIYYFVINKLSFFNIFKNQMGGIKQHLRKNFLRVTYINISSTLDRLAPWDEYLVPVNVGFDTEIIGKNLMELRLRERFNVNIIAIGRDMKTIISPKPTDIIMGGDTLLVYGNEESISKLEQFATHKITNEKSPSLDECVLGKIILPQTHAFVGKSILDLGIRSKYNCIILAINRNNDRIKNPLSTFVFEAGDEVFIFGTKQTISELSLLQ